MSPRRPTVAFLLFAVLALGLTGWMFRHLDDAGRGATATHLARFDDVNGLRPGNDVRLAGVRVGHVRDVRVEDGRAAVRLDVADDVALPRDTVAAVRWVNLIGVNEVVLLPGEDDGVLADGEEIPHTRSATDLAMVAETLGPLTETLDPQRVNVLVEAVLGMLQGREADVGRLVSDLDVALATITEREDLVDGLVTDYAALSETIATRDEQIRQLTDHLVTVTEAFDDADAAIQAAIDDPGRMLAILDRFLAATSDDLTTVLADLQVVTETVAGDLGTLEASITTMPQALEAAYATTQRADAVELDVCSAVTAPPCTSVGVFERLPGRSVVEADAAELRRLLLGTPAAGAGS